MAIDPKVFARLAARRAQTAKAATVVPEQKPVESKLPATAEPKNKFIAAQEAMAAALAPKQAPIDDWPLDPAEKIQAMLKKLDEMISSETGIEDIKMQLARGLVRDIMIDLKEQPELDSLIIDRDVHNIMYFIQHVKLQAVAANQGTKERKVKKEAKTARSSAFAEAMKNVPLPTGLTGLGDLKS